MNITSVVDGNSVNVTVSVDINATGNITITYGSEKFTEKIVDGTALFKLANMKTGEYNITASYSGDKIYNSEIAKSNFTIDKINTTLSFTVVGGLLFVNLS